MQFVRLAPRRTGISPRPGELERLLADDLAILLSETFADAAISFDTPRPSHDEAVERRVVELPAGTVTFLLTDIEGPHGCGRAIRRRWRSRYISMIACWLK
jgi:hypothetical protein